MISFVTTVQLTAILASAVLVGICWMTAVKSRDQTSEDRNRSLGSLVEQLEQNGYGPFKAISRRESSWVVEVYREGVACEVIIDPESGEILAEDHEEPECLPPKELLPLSK